MASPKHSWAAVVSKGAPTVHATSQPDTWTTATATATAEPAGMPVQPRVAFISGHIDITPTQFAEKYAATLDATILRGDAFILSNAGGVDTLALAYLRSHNVEPSRITIYMHTARQNRKLNATQIRINKMRMGLEVEERYQREGCNFRSINGYHNEQDAAMTEVSDHDIPLGEGLSGDGSPVRR